MQKTANVTVPLEKRHSPCKRLGLFDVIWNKVHVYMLQVKILLHSG